MGWDYWVYQNQPVWFLKEVQELMEKEWYERKKAEMSNKIKNQ